MNVVITGGRNFSDGARIAADLRALQALGLRRVAHGGARGADALAHKAAIAFERVDVDMYEVSRRLDGSWPAAGPRRNIRMLKMEQPDLVLAYPDKDSRGTWHCIRSALAMGIIVAVWAPSLRSADALAMVGDGHGWAADEPRLVIGRAPIMPHALARIVLTLDGGAS